MSFVIVVPEVRQLPPAARWAKLVAPLSEELNLSGLGRILNLDSLRREANEFGRIEEEELAVELKHREYGYELVERVVTAAGLSRSKPETPRCWLSYHCEDYYKSALAQQGYWDEPGQLWLIEPAQRVEEEVELDFLQVGRPGVDNIGFGYRKGHHGFWAFHRMERAFQYLAPSIVDFLDSWLSGRIRL